MKRYAVFATVDEALAGTVRRYQAALSQVTGDLRALRFPVHITLRGPFQTPSTALHRLSGILREAARSFPGCIELELNGPVFTEPDLCWFEIGRGATGFSALRRLHVLLDDLTARHVARDDVPKSFVRSGYRPHTTIGWGADGEACCVALSGGRNLRLTGAVEKVTIVRYPEGWPAHGIVEVVESIPLV